jgi:acetyl-CoA C-acetyltransferase
MEADPTHTLECSGVGDGAAAVLLLPADAIETEVEVASTAVATDSYYLEGRKDLLEFDAARRASERALDAASVSHSDVDILEVHDDTTITGVLSLESLGFVERGMGASYVAGGNTTRGGELPTNTFGGLKARGDPLGATGLYQICEMVMQLRGEAGPCQVEGAEVGMAQSLGGVGSTCAVSVLRRA